MSADAWSWWIGAASALASGMLALRGARCGATPGRAAAAALWTAFVLAFAGATAGLGWRAVASAAWPGVRPPDALALLAGGGLVVAAWSALGGRPAERVTVSGAALGSALLAVAAILGAAALSAPAWPATALDLPAGAWLLGLRNLLASIGLGGWLPTLAASLAWYRRAVTGSLAPPAPPADAAARPDEPAAAALAAPVLARPAEDLGRSAALFTLPWLTAACLAGGGWNMLSYVALNRAVAADLWLLVAWLLGAAYLHVTSAWRPLRLPGWLAPLLAAAALAAGLLAASTAGTLR